jgi:ADP-ribosyltransferase exoenzyme
MDARHGNGKPGIQETLPKWTSIMKYDLIAEAYVDMYKPDNDDAVLKDGVIIALSGHYSRDLQEETFKKNTFTYTVDSYEFNKALHTAHITGQEVPAEIRQKLDFNEFDSQLKENGSNKPTSLYMGIRWNPEKFKESKRIHLPSYSSTSRDASQAARFTVLPKRNILKIDTNGFQHTPVDHISRYPHEQEHILPRGTTLEITSEPYHGERFSIWPTRIVNQKDFNESVSQPNDTEMKPASEDTARSYVIHMKKGSVLHTAMLKKAKSMFGSDFDMLKDENKSLALSGGVLSNHIKDFKKKKKTEKQFSILDSSNPYGTTSGVASVRMNFTHDVPESTVHSLMKHVDPSGDHSIEMLKTK